MEKTVFDTSFSLVTVHTMTNTLLISHETVQLWGQSICPIAAGDFKWAYVLTFTGYL